MMKFEDMSNELLLCIWDQLTFTDVIYSFSNLNNRIHQLLLKFYKLYRELDLCYCSLTTLRYFCQQLSVNEQWRLNLTVLKLNNRYRCSQTHMFTKQVKKFFISKYFANQEQQSVNLSTNLSRMKIEPFFPQLKSLFVFQSLSIDEECRDILLYLVAGTSTLRTLIWRLCSYQTHHSNAFFDWLFRCSMNINSFRLKNPLGENGFQLTYQHILINDYLPHQSLTHLTINVFNLCTLEILLHYLPKLQYLDIHISDVIEFTNIIDHHQSTTLIYSQELHTLKLKYLNIRGKGYICLEQFVEKFAQSLVNFSLSMYHRYDNEPDLSYNGDHLMNLCQKLFYLQSLDFAIQVQLFEIANIETITRFTTTFRTSFWLNGPIGCKRVGVTFHQVYRMIQMFSLPYTFIDNPLYLTIDLINIQFNTNEENVGIPWNLSLTLEPLWYKLNHLSISLIENQKVPLVFLQALQCPHSHGKRLTILHKRGIMPENVEDHVQLTQFCSFELIKPNDININSTYLQELHSWLRILPNIKCLDIDLVELKYWLTIGLNHQYLKSFLHRIDQLYINCSSIINAKINEEIMEPLLEFVIAKHYFPKLRCLRFMNCKNVSSAWHNIDQWINFVLTHIGEHQLTCVRFDFIEKECKITDLQTDDQSITVIDPPCVVNIHRFIGENHVGLWIERKRK